MKKVQWFLGIVFSLALILVLLISSFQFAAYGDFGFYEKEYKKYDVVSDLDMELKDVMYVTYEMMDYLIGDRENLDVYIVVEGKEQDFFNEQDKLHMADVKNLSCSLKKSCSFQPSILDKRITMVRRVSAAVMLLCLFVLWVTKANWKKILARGYQIGLGIATAGVVFLAGALIVDFNTAFTVFHEIFFTNDLWLFDPAEDYMIRMLPEGFFYDMALRIGGIFIISMLIFLAVSVFLARQAKKDENERKIKSTYE